MTTRQIDKYKKILFEEGFKDEYVRDQVYDFGQQAIEVLVDKEITDEENSLLLNSYIEGFCKQEEMIGKKLKKHLERRGKWVLQIA